MNQRTSDPDAILLTPCTQIRIYLSVQTLDSNQVNVELLSSCREEKSLPVQTPLLSSRLLSQSITKPMKSYVTFIVGGAQIIRPHLSINPCASHMYETSHTLLYSSDYLLGCSISVRVKYRSSLKTKSTPC